MGYIQAIEGAGCVFGPIIGSGLYFIGGYSFLFYSFGTIFLISSMFVKKLFTAEIDISIENSQQFLDEKEEVS